MFVVELGHGFYVSNKESPFVQRETEPKYAERLSFEEAKSLKASVGGYKKGYGEIYCSIHELCEDIDGLLYIRPVG